MDHWKNRQYNTGIAPGEISPFCLLVGDPSRAERVASYFSNIEYRLTNREYLTITGSLDGHRITVMGTGMGAANIEMALIELSQCSKTRLSLIRCGSCGGIQPYISLGDLVISSSAYRMENTTLSYVGEGFPAVAHPEITLSLIRAADLMNLNFHVGITATAPSFYSAQGRNVPPYPMQNSLVIEQLRSQGIENLEMEVSALFTMAMLGRHRAGAVCAVYADRVNEEFITEDHMKNAEKNCIEVGLNALLYLHKMDYERGTKNYWYPGVSS